MTELGLALSTLCLSARSPSAMAVAHGETGWRAPALTIGASVVPMIDAARAAEHADLMPVTKSPTEPGGRLASSVDRILKGEKPVAAIALANKLARMAWAMMAKGERYRNPVALAA